MAYNHGAGPMRSNPAHLPAGKPSSGSSSFAAAKETVESVVHNIGAAAKSTLSDAVFGSSAPTQKADAATCIRAGCGRRSWNGKRGEYCSRSCRNEMHSPGGSWQAKPATCPRPGCGQPSWNGQPRQYCSKLCRDERPATHVGRPLGKYDLDQPGPFGPSSPPASPAATIGAPKFIKCSFQGPPCDGVIGFYNPGRATPVDQACQAMVLGNFFMRPLQIQNAAGEFARFENAEAAFQALKFWHCKDRFRTLSGQEAFSLKQGLTKSHGPDFTYGGWGSNWKAMYHVLECKFTQDEELLQALMATGNSFLLEHNEKAGRDQIWSNNQDGTGKNWLGLQLMMLRDELGQTSTWTSWLRQKVDLETGDVLGDEWPRMVMTATHAVKQHLQDDVPRSFHRAGYGGFGGV